MDRLSVAFLSRYIFSGDPQRQAALEAAILAKAGPIPVQNDVDPARIEMLQARLAQVEAIPVRDTSQKGKALVITQVRSFLDQGRIEEADKLLAALAAKLKTVAPTGPSSPTPAPPLPPVDPARLAQMEKQHAHLSKVTFPPDQQIARERGLAEIRRCLDAGDLDRAYSFLKALAQRSIPPKPGASVGQSAAARPAPLPPRDLPPPPPPRDAPPPPPPRDAPPPRPTMPPPDGASAVWQPAVPSAPPRPTSPLPAAPPAAAAPSAPTQQPPAAPPRPAAPAPAAPPLKKLEILGADFRNNDKMKELTNKLGEEANAQVNLIRHKLGDTAPAPGSPWLDAKTYFEKLSNRIVAINIERRSALDNDDETALAKAHKDYTDIVAEKKKRTAVLQPLWLADKQKQATLAATKGESSTEHMFKNFGVEFLEMAQMAEVFAAKKGFDPYTAQKESKKDPKQGPKKPMEMGEIGAIYGYSTQDFTKINGLLRGVKDPDVDPDVFNPYIDACKQGLEKLPVYKKGAVLRCEPSAKYFIDDLFKTGLRTERGFMSSGFKKVPGFGDVVMHITKVKTGREITQFSLHETEGEVLFPPGSVFKFVKFEDGKGLTIKKHSDLNKLGVDPTTGKFNDITSGEFWFVQKS